MKRISFSLLLTLLLFSWHIPTKAQTTEVVYLCVQSVSETQPYLFGFRNTDLVGFMFSEESEIVVYGNVNVDINIDVFEVSTDAQSGGYRRVSDRELDSTRVTNIDPIDDPTCEGDIPEGLYSSSSVTLTSNRAVVIQQGGDTRSGEAFIGSVALHFVPKEGEKAKNLQIIQFQRGPIDLTFPFIKERTDYVVVANKEIAVQKSYFADTPFRNTAAANNQEGLAEQLEVELGLQLITIMETGRFRIYPAYGFADEYFPTGFIRLEIGDSPAQRIPQFAENQQVNPLKVEETEAHYYLPDQRNEPWGSLQSRSNPLTVKEVTAQGELIVEANGERVIIEAWYVEVVPPG